MLSKNTFYITCAFILCLRPALANNLENALRETYMACVRLDDAMANLKKLAGINIAVSGVGVATGAGATVVGIVKSETDKVRMNKLRSVYDNENFDFERTIDENADVSDMDITQIYTEDIRATYQSDQNANQLDKKSKELGNWRTGLLAANSATNIAGAIISDNSRINEDLSGMITNCKSAIQKLKSAKMQARVEGIDITEADRIISACSQYETVDINSVNKYAKISMASSIVGSATGVAGTVSSAVANSDKIRSDNTDNKEKNLNTTANILAGASTVMSGISTGLNIAQTNAIKHLLNIAEECTESLK